MPRASRPSRRLRLVSREARAALWHGLYQGVARFVDRAGAVPLISDAVPPPPRETVTMQVLAGLRQMAEDGYVTVHEAGLDAREMSILEELEASGQLP